MEDYELNLFKRNKELKKRLSGLKYERKGYCTQKNPDLNMELDRLERQIRLNDLVLWGL